MRTILFILLIIGIIGTGYGVTHSDIFVSNKIAPKAEWPKIITGKWKYTTKFQSKWDLWIANGGIEFFDTHNFELSATGKFFHSVDLENDIRHNYSKTTSGGRVSGVWRFLNDSIIQMTSSKCNITSSYVSTGYESRVIGCADFASFMYGTFSNENCDIQVKAFNEDEILLKGKSLNDEGEISYLLTRTK
jgi:hypothetical protein